MTTSYRQRKALSSGLLLVISHPLEYDIICAKDKVFAKHTGNLLYAERIEKTKIAYQQAETRTEKMKITKEFVQYMQSKYGSRFLKRHGDEWVEITDLQARDKVSHALRFASRQERAATPTTTTSVNRYPFPASTNKNDNDGIHSLVDLHRSSSQIAETEDVFQRQQQLLHALQQEASNEDDRDDDDVVPPKQPSSESAPRMGSFVCFQNKIKMSILEPPAFHAINSCDMRQLMTVTLDRQQTSDLHHASSPPELLKSTTSAILKRSVSSFFFEPYYADEATKPPAFAAIKSEDLHRLLTAPLDFEE